MRTQAELAVIFLLIFALALPGLLDNMRRNEVRMDCRQAVVGDGAAILFGAASNSYSDNSYSGPSPAECGYMGLPIRTDANMTSVVEKGVWPFLRWGMGTCEEYSNRTEQLLPTAPPSPFVWIDDVRMAACHRQERPKYLRVSSGGSRGRSPGAVRARLHRDSPAPPEGCQRQCTDSAVNWCGSVLIRQCIGAAVY